MKVFFHTNIFDELIPKASIKLTKDPRETDLLVLGSKKVIYDQFVHLKAVYRFGVGDENIDFEYLKKKNIPIYFPEESTKKILYEETANFTVYGILRLLFEKTLGNTDTWKRNQRDFLGQKNALVIGTGNIGSRVASKLKVFMNVKTYDVRENKFTELEPLIRGADVITIHVPLSKETNSFFDQEKLSWVKDGACLINTARGELFNEVALYSKLSSSSCRAYFDVFWQEPYSGKLKELGPDKFFMTPHSASNTKEFVLSGFDEMVNIYSRMMKENAYKGSL